MELIVKWDVFKDQISAFIGEADLLLKREGQVYDEPSLNKFKEEIKEWDKRCYNFLRESFESKDNDYANSFFFTRAKKFKVGNKQKDPQQEKQDALEEIRNKRRMLQQSIKLLGVSDAVIRPGEIDIEARKNYSTEETRELILSKLYELYDDFYYPVKIIIEGNGIEIKRRGDDRELIRWLESEGLINADVARGFANAQLSPQGKMYVEDKRKAKSFDYDRISSSQAEIDSKINTIISELEKFGLGQEILYEELEELKELYSKLNKKNWGQVLKGKLVDLSLSKAISPEVANYVYSEFTEQKLNGLIN